MRTYRGMTWLLVVALLGCGDAAWEIGERRSALETELTPDADIAGEFGPPKPGERPPGERPPGERPPEERPPGERPPGERPPGERPPGERPPGETAPEPRKPGPAEQTILDYLAQHKVSPEFLAELKKVIKDLKDKGFFTEAADADNALRLAELMASQAYADALAKEVQEWADWVKAHAKDYKTLDEATQAYFEMVAKREGYGLNTIPNQILTPEAFARRFHDADGKRNLAGRDLAFRNRAAPTDADAREANHQQVIHFFQLTALLRLDKAALDRLLDSLGKFRYKGTSFTYDLNGVAEESTTIWGVLFDAFSRQAPYHPEMTSPSIQNVYAELAKLFP